MISLANTMTHSSHGTLACGGKFATPWHGLVALTCGCRKTAESVKISDEVVCAERRFVIPKHLY